MTNTPRVAHSMDDLRVGQIVSYVDHKDQRNDGLFEVAFVDPPEAILKDLHNGWPRIKWQISDFKYEHIELVILSEKFATINCCEHCPLEEAP